MHGIIIGLDEAGYGTWAGPLTAGVVVLHEHTKIVGVRDSKKMSEEKREESIDLIYEQSLYSYAAVQEPEDIDKYGVTACWQRLFHGLAVLARNLYPKAKIIVDGNRLITGIDNQEPIPKADDIYPAVMAASVLAKYTQCLWMDDYHVEFPHFGFDTHRGYGTAKHKRMLEAYGPCPIHRKSYKPIQKLYSQQCD